MFTIARLVVRQSLDGHGNGRGATFAGTDANSAAVVAAHHECLNQGCALHQKGIGAEYQSGPGRLASRLRD